jgi:hypothetical protein
MSPLITYLLLLFIGLYVVILIADTVVFHRYRSAILQLALIGVLIGVLHATTDFPAVSQAFGGSSPLIAILVMFLGTVFGIIANAVFQSSKTVNWRSLLKSLVLSPIVLLPLLGAVERSAHIDTLHVVSLAFLAFQNGFFWRQVLDHARPKT